MGSTTVGRRAAGMDPRDENPIANRELLHLQANVEPDGSAVTLSFHLAAGDQIDLSVPIQAMPATVAELGEAGMLMMSRRFRDRAKGRSTLEDLMRAAPRAKSITPTIDRKTGDVTIVYRFPDRMPFSVRLTKEQYHEARVVFSAELRRNSN